MIDKLIVDVAIFVIAWRSIDDEFSSGEKNIFPEMFSYIFPWLSK